MTSIIKIKMIFLGMLCIPISLFAMKIAVVSSYNANPLHHLIVTVKEKATTLLPNLPREEREQFCSKWKITNFDDAIQIECDDEQYFVDVHWLEDYEAMSQEWRISADYYNRIAKERKAFMEAIRKI